MVVANVVYDLVQVTLKWVPVHTLRKVFDCLHDKNFRFLDVKPFHLHLPKYPLQFVIW